MAGVLGAAPAPLSCDRPAGGMSIDSESRRVICVGGAGTGGGGNESFRSLAPLSMGLVAAVSPAGPVLRTVPGTETGGAAAGFATGAGAGSGAGAGAGGWLSSTNAPRSARARDLAGNSSLVSGAPAPAIAADSLPSPIGLVLRTVPGTTAGGVAGTARAADADVGSGAGAATGAGSGAGAGAAAGAGAGAGAAAGAAATGLPAWNAQSAG